MVRIREPRDSEVPACRMLLPETHRDPQWRQFRLAIDGDTGNEIVGALSFRDDGPAISGLRLHVVAGRRRSGTGSQLLEHVIAHARTIGRSKISGSADIQSETDAEPFLAARGFHITSRLTMIEDDVAKTRDSIRAARAKFQTSEALPPSARIVGIDEAPMAELVSLYAEHIAHVPDAPGLRRVLKLDRYRESVILLIDGKIAGVLLAEITDGVLSAPAWIVPPAYRDRHIGALLRATLVERVQDRVQRVRFEYLDSAPVSAKVRREAGYTSTRILAQFERAVTA
jgi:GNAT superfamily N-acetyltransferase